MNQARFWNDLRYDFNDSTSWWFQPIWKIISQIGSSPQVGVKMKNIWNHHLVPEFDILNGPLNDMFVSLCFLLVPLLGKQRSLIDSVSGSLGFFLGYVINQFLVVLYLFLTVWIPVIPRGPGINGVKNQQISMNNGSCHRGLGEKWKVLKRRLAELWSKLHTGYSRETVSLNQYHTTCVAKKQKDIWSQLVATNYHWHEIMSTNYHIKCHLNNHTK